MLLSVVLVEPMVLARAAATASTAQAHSCAPEACAQALILTDGSSKVSSHEGATSRSFTSNCSPVPAWRRCHANLHGSSAHLTHPASDARRCRILRPILPSHMKMSKVLTILCRQASSATFTQGGQCAAREW